MTATTDPVALATTDLAAAEPDLLPGFVANLPRATDVVSRRLLAAAYREDLAGARTGAIWLDGSLVALPSGVHHAVRRGFDQIELLDPVPTAPERLLGELGIAAPGLAAELADARVNLAVAYARREGIDARLRATGAGSVGAALAHPAGGRAPSADERLLGYEQLATEGHNLHPCGRTRLGWRVADVLRHDQESPGTTVAFLAVRGDLLVGDDIGAALRAGYRLPEPPPGYRLQPVHAWQLAEVLPGRYADLFASGALLPVPDATLAARPTTALRTVLLEPAADGLPRYLKLSLDIQVTSTRRTISVASTRNGPAISALLSDLLAGSPDVLLFPEVAGAAVVAPPADPDPAGVATARRERDVSAILRLGLSGRLAPGEQPVPAAALPAHSPLTGRTVLGELLDAYPGPALDFLADYARVLLRPVLRLAALGVGLEAHLQNSVPILRAGRPHRIAFRDFAGLRLHAPRLRAHAPDLALWPGSVTVTDDLAVMRAKVGYTALQAHLGELVRLVGVEAGIPEPPAWRVVREVLDAESVEPGDHAFLTAPRVPHKALVRMRLAGHGDEYVPVDNPLHGA